MPFGDVLSVGTVTLAWKALDVGWIDRVYSPLVTLWVFLGQVLSQDHPCRAAYPLTFNQNEGLPRGTQVVVMIVEGHSGRTSEQLPLADQVAVRRRLVGIDGPQHIAAVDGGIALRSLTIWLVLIAAEIAHGILRAIVIVPFVGEFRSNQIGALTGSGIILLIAYFTIRWIGAKRRSELLGKW